MCFQVEFAQRLRQADVRVTLTVGNVLVFLQSRPDARLESAVVELTSLLLPRLSAADPSFERLLGAMVSRTSHEAVRHALCGVIAACGRVSLGESHISLLARIVKSVMASKHPLVQHAAMDALAQFSQMTPQAHVLDRIIPQETKSAFRAFLSAARPSPQPFDSVRQQQLKEAIQAILGDRKRAATPDVEFEPASVKRLRPSSCEQAPFDTVLGSVDELLSARLPQWVLQEMSQMRDRIAQIQQQCTQ